MVEEITNETPAEEDIMYEYIHDDFYSDKKNKEDGTIYISRSFFKTEIKRRRELSADWDKKTDPISDPNYTNNHTDDPNKYGVISQIVKKIKDLHEGITIDYTPNQTSIAHCDIKFDETITQNGKLVNEIAIKLSKLSKWEKNYPFLNNQNAEA